MSCLPRRRRTRDLNRSSLVIVGVIVTVAAVTALLAWHARSGMAAKAITITKKTDQSTPELFSNFTPGAGLGAGGRLAQVSGTIDCTGGLGSRHLARIRVKVIQSGAIAEGFALAQCVGHVQPWSAVVVTRGSERLRPGAATGHAWVGLPQFGSGMSHSFFDWSRSITLLR